MEKSKNRALIVPKNMSLKSPEERFKVMNEIEQGHMTQSEAATILKVSPRHVRRLITDYKKKWL
jgi:predicted XRE-type DNA-binding protein